MADQENPSAQKRKRSKFIKRQGARFELSAIFPRSKKQLSDSSEADTTLKRSQSTPWFPSIPSVISFEDTSDEVQFADALESILINNDSGEKHKANVKQLQGKYSCSHWPHYYNQDECGPYPHNTRRRHQVTATTSRWQRSGISSSTPRWCHWRGSTPSRNKQSR